MLQQPYQKQLENTERVLIAGMGGGFDLYVGLPLYFNLLAAGKQVILANLTFANLKQFDLKWLTDTMVRVTPQSPEWQGYYFPEWYLHNWFEAHDSYTPPIIYAFERTGVIPLHVNYEYLVREHEIDTVILVDGGTDSLMRGDEDGLGTPHEDMLSLAAVSMLTVERKMMVCLGFGVDHFHAVSNDLTLEAVAQLTQMDGFMGSSSLVAGMTGVTEYQEIVAYATREMSVRPSIVSTSIVSAIEGHYGDHHATDRTAGSTLWINPLMAIYWFFDLDTVAQRNQMIERLFMTEYFDQVGRQITRFQRTRADIRRRRRLPD